MRCAHCGAKERVVIAAGAAADGKDADEASATERRCPKCQALVAQRSACPACGLAADRMSTFAAAREAVSPELEATWQEVLAGWNEQARHDAFVQAAAAARAFAFAAGKYQEATRSRPADPIAPRQLQRVRRTAEAAMLASAQVRHVEQTPYRSATAVLILLVVALVAGGVYATFLRNTRGAANAEGEPRSVTPGPLGRRLPVPAPR